MTGSWRVLGAMVAVTHLSALNAEDGAASAASRARMQGTVRGVVYDSLAERPLAGAIVQLVPSDDASGAMSGTGAVATDSIGRFAFRDVPHGRYTIGFLHPILDSLGVEPPTRAVAVEGTAIVRADLAVPSAARLRLAICGGESAEQASAVITGIVRDATTGDPVDSARVAGAWAEISLGRSGVQRRVPNLVTRSRSNGWFAICGVPRQGALQLTASHHTDSADVVEVDVPSSGFLRRDVYIGTARTAFRADSSTADSSGSRSSFSVGNGVIHGTVVAAQGARRLAGAQVSIINGPQVRTNERGEWTINNAPPGTRMLEIRAVGYYPHRVAVDVINDAPPLNASLVTFKAMLDTMKVRANYDRFSSLAGFRERQKSGVGHFLTTDDVSRRRPVVTTDLFRAVPGLFMDGPRGSDQLVLMRGAFDPRCVPTIVLNGALMTGLSANEIDAFVAPRDIIGIEVYAASYVPAQFQFNMGSCGSIVIWSR